MMMVFYSNIDLPGDQEVKMINVANCFPHSSVAAN